MNPRTLLRIALAVFRDSVRDRVLYNLVGFALLVIGASFLIGQLTAGQDVKIIKDLGLAAMSVFGLFIAVFKFFHIIYIHMGEISLHLTCFLNAMLCNGY